MQRTRYVHYYLAAFIALATFALYLPALRNEFVNWDDGPYVFANVYIRSLDAAFFRWAFLGFRISNWHPLTWISHALDYAVWGLNPLGHHLTNIILHGFNTFLVVLLVMRLLEAAQGSGYRVQGTGFGVQGSRFGVQGSGFRVQGLGLTVHESRITNHDSPLTTHDSPFTLIAAGVTGLLFGIHPVHVESVAWVSERKDLLCALFFLLSVMAYAKAAGRMAHGAEGNKLPPSALLSALSFFALALMSKPMAVTLPVVLLILDWYPFKRMTSLPAFRTAAAEKIPFFALSLISSIITVLAQKSGDTLSSLDAVPAATRLLVSAHSLIAYIGKMLLPLNLIPLYPYPRDAALASVAYGSAILLTIGITAACILLAKKQKVWLAAWGYYLVTLLPVLGIIQVGNQAMADRYTYLPSIGPFLLAGLCIAWLSVQVIAANRAALVIKAIGVAITFSLIACLSLLTVKQTAVWRNSIGLWTYVIEKAPEKIPLMFVNRGAAYQKVNLFDKAIADYETAITLDPAAYRAYISLAAVFEQMDQLDRAMEAIDRAIALHPSSQEAYRNRGVLSEKMGRYDDAIMDYTRAIAAKPDYYEAFNNRGLIYAKTGQLDKAIADYNEAIAINPRYFSAFTNRGVAFTLSGHYDAALDDFNRAVALGQDDSLAYYNRGMFYRRMGNQELASADVRKACDLGNEKACGMLRQMMQ